MMTAGATPSEAFTGVASRSAVYSPHLNVPRFKRHRFKLLLVREASKPYHVIYILGPYN
jgi:hypothetical protein